MSGLAWTVVDIVLAIAFLALFVWAVDGSRWRSDAGADTSTPVPPSPKDDPTLALFNVHDPLRCVGRPCVIHDPSDHHMRAWDMNWRNDRGLVERICGHGIGHPDPDDLSYKESVGRIDEGIHACDGCCAVSR